MHSGSHIGRWEIPAFPLLQTPHVVYSVLLKYRREIGLGDVVGEGAVAEDAGAVAGRGEFLVPGDYALGQGLDVLTGDLGGKAGHQHAAADTVHGQAVLALLLRAFVGPRDGSRS